MKPVVSSLLGPRTSLTRVITHEIVLKQVFPKEKTEAILSQTLHSTGNRSTWQDNITRVWGESVPKIRYVPLTVSATYSFLNFLDIVRCRTTCSPFPFSFYVCGLPASKANRKELRSYRVCWGKVVIHLYTSAQDLRQDFTSESVSQRKAASQVACTLSFRLQKPFSKARVHINSQFRGPHCCFDHMPGSFCFSVAGMSGQIMLPCSGKPCWRLLSLATNSIWHEPFLKMET